MAEDMLRRWNVVLLKYLASFVNSFCDGGQVDVPFPDLVLTPNKFKSDNDAEMLLYF